MFQDNYNFSAILNDLFISIEKQAVITIRYEAYPLDPNDEYVVDFRIRSVNGFSNPVEFGDEIYDHGNTFLSEVARIMRKIPKSRQSEFGIKITDRFSTLMEQITYEDNIIQNRPFTQEDPPGFFHFMQPNFEGNGFHDSAVYMDMILYAASDFAYFWCTSMSQIFDELCNLINTIKHLPELHGHTEPPPAFEKIRVRLTVPQLTAFFLVLVKNNLIDVTNKSDLFRALAEIFQTKGSNNLSWRNIKNTFDSPSPDDIEYWEREFQTLSDLAKHIYRQFYN